MAVKAKETFSKFLNLCEPYLKKEKSMDLVKLLQRRFIDCNEEYKLSAEFINLTEITGAKIESDNKHIFVHLRDYISKLKLHQTDDRKRKRQVTSADDHDAPNPKSFKGEKTNIIEQTDFKSGTCVKEQCITIEDSDDEEDTQTNFELKSTTKKSQLNGNALDQSASYSKSQTKTNLSDAVNHHSKSRPHSHKLKLSKTTKYQSQTHSAPLIQNVSHHRNSNLLSSEVNKKSPVKSNEINDQADISPAVNKKQHDKDSVRRDVVTVVLIDDDDDDELKDENKDNINLEVGDEEKDGYDASHSISLDTDQVNMKEVEDMQVENKETQDLDEKVIDQDENLDENVKDQEENKQKDENLDENVKDQEENKQKDENLDENVKDQEENKQKDENLDENVKDQEENKQKDENLDENVKDQEENKQKDENLDENVKDQEENKQKDENLDENVKDQEENKQKDENLDENVKDQEENKQKDENLDENVKDQEENKQKDENVKDQEENKQKDENLEEKVNDQDENKQKVENLDGNVKKVPDKQNMENNDENDSFTCENQNITIDSSIQQSSMDINSTSSDGPIDDADNGKTSKISSNEDTIATNRDEESKKDSFEDVEMVDATKSDVTLHTNNEHKISDRTSEPEISDRTSEPEISKEDPETEISELKISTKDSEPKICVKDSEAEICKEDSEPEISDNLRNQSHVNDNESGLKQSENIEKQTKEKDRAESTNIRNDSLEMDTDSKEKQQWKEDDKPGTSSENRSCPAKKEDDEKLKDEGNSERENDEEKAKTGSKKQIARLEKLLEDLRNKIEELKEKELSLDDMDDECSSYIMEEKYQRKFVKVWNKLCELKQKSAATGRPSERRFKYSGTRYPEINRKIEKFINKKKQFPDYHDIHSIVTRVSLNKKIGLGSSAVERLAREAFLDVGESLQKRRRQDLMYTSAGHFKLGERPTEDPALSDPELKKKLSSNRKLSRENMDQVLNKFSEKQFHVIEEEVEIVTDQSDDGEEEEEQKDEDDDDVPELTTILEDRGSPVLENLQEKGQNMLKKKCLIDDDDTIEDVPMDTDTFIIETDNAEHVDDSEVTIATGCRAKSEVDTDSFVIETDNAEIVDDSEITIVTGLGDKSEDKTSGDEQTFGKTVVLWEKEEDDLNESIINNTTVCYDDGVDEENSELSRNKITDLKNENIYDLSLTEQADKNNKEFPILYTAVKIDDIEVKNCSQKGNNSVESTNKKARRRSTGDDDLFAMSGVEEMSDSEDESHCDNEISNIIKKLDSPVQMSDGKIVSHAQTSSPSIEQADTCTNCSEKTLDGNTSHALEHIDLIRTNILSQSAKDKIKNLLHLPGSIKNDKREILNQDEISNSEVKEVEKSNRISQLSAEIEDEEKMCEKDLSTKSFILNSSVKRRACNVLSLKTAKIPRLTKHSASSDSESDMIIESPTFKDMTIDEQKTASSYIKPLIESSPSESVIEISEDFVISAEATYANDLQRSSSIDSYIDSEDIMTLSMNVSSQESIDMVTGHEENKMSLDAASKDSPEFVTGKTENELSPNRSSKDGHEIVSGKTENELSLDRSSKDGIEIVTEKTENELSPNRSSKDSIEILKEQVENECDEELSGGNKDDRTSHFINRSDSQKSDSFLTIVDVTSIGLEEYNSDSSDSYPKLVKRFEIKSKTSDEIKSASNKISSLFGKGEKISSFLSKSCTGKQENNRSKHLRDTVDSEDEEGPSECICIDDVTSSSKNKKTNSAENKLLNKEKQKSDVVQKTLSKVTSSSSMSSNTDNSVDDDIEILGEDNFVTFDTEDGDIIILSDSD